MPRTLKIAVVQPDAALAVVVGAEPMKRTQVTVKIWDYIREHQLQDPTNRRVIRADDKLRAVFDGNDSCTMFELQKHIGGHIAFVGLTEA